MKPEKMRELLREARDARLGDAKWERSARLSSDAPRAEAATEAYQHALDMLECVIKKRHLREPGATACCRCGSPMRRASR